MRRIALVALLVSAACTSPQLRLEHVIGGRDGSATYAWKLTSATIIESSTEVATKRTELEADVKIERRRSGEATILRVSVQPRRYLEDGIAAAELRPIELSYTLDETSTVGSSPPGEEEQRSAILVTLLGQEFAALDGRQVDIGDRWRSDLRLSGVEALDLQGSSTLNGFRLADRRRNAVVSTSRSGALRSSQRIGRASADLSGTIEQRISSLLDIDDGSLTSSDTRSRAVLEVTVAGAKQAIVTVTQRSVLRLGSYSSV